MGGKKHTNSVFRLCKTCFGERGNYSYCCEGYVHNNKCSECGKFCKSTPCLGCYGEGGEDISVGDKGTFVLNKYNSFGLEHLSEKEINIIRKHSSLSETFDDIYFCYITVINILQDEFLLVKISEHEDIKFKIRLNDFCS